MTTVNRVQLAFVLGYDGENEPAGAGTVYIDLGALSPELSAKLVEGVKAIYQYTDGSDDESDLEWLALERTLLSYAPTPGLMLTVEEVTGDIRSITDPLGIELEITPPAASNRQLPDWARNPAK